MVGVIGLTSVLAERPPAKAFASQSSPVFATEADIGDLRLNLVVDPARAGSNELHLYFLDRRSQITEVEEARIQATLPSAGIGPLRFEARRLAPGHYAALGTQLFPPGDWQLLVEVRRGEFDLDTATVQVPIRED